jgi:hypothetical protein
MTRINFALAGTFMFFQLLTSITTHDIEFWSSTISHYRSLLRLQSHSFDMTKLACTRMDLLAAGMGVDPPIEQGEGIGEIVGKGRMGRGRWCLRRAALRSGSLGRDMRGCYFVERMSVSRLVNDLESGSLI